MIVDECTRFTWVLFLILKSETVYKLNNFIKGIEVVTKLSIRRIQSDNGSEFANATIKNFLTDKGVEHNVSAPDTAQQNGVVERTSRT